MPAQAPFSSGAGLAERINPSPLCVSPLGSFECVFAAYEVVLRRSAARRPTRAEVRRSHDASVVTPPLRFAKLCRYRVAESRAGGRRACESVFPPPHSPRERLKAGHREAWPRARACLAVSRHRPSIRGTPRTLATIRPPVAARPPPRARHYCCRESRCSRAEILSDSLVCPCVRRKRQR